MKIRTSPWPVRPFAGTSTAVMPSTRPSFNPTAPRWSCGYSCRTRRCSRVSAGVGSCSVQWGLCSWRSVRSPPTFSAARSCVPSSNWQTPPSGSAKAISRFASPHPGRRRSTTSVSNSTVWQGDSAGCSSRSGTPRPTSPTGCVPRSRPSVSTSTACRSARRGSACSTISTTWSARSTSSSVRRCVLCRMRGSPTWARSWPTGWRSGRRWRRSSRGR